MKLNATGGRYVLLQVITVFIFQRAPFNRFSNCLRPILIKIYEIGVSTMLLPAEEVTASPRDLCPSSTVQDLDLA